MFTLTGGKWTGPTDLNLGTKARSGDYLGSSVALSADGHTALAGVLYRTVNGQSDAGAAEVFTFSGGHWGGPVELSLGNKAAESDLLGTSVALSGDGRTALVGASYGRSMARKGLAPSRPSL